MASLVDKYLNLNNNGLNFLETNNLNDYIKYFKEFSNNPDNIRIYIENKLLNYLDEKYNNLNKDCDINYYLERINEISKIKFYNIINELDINLLISMINYFNDEKLEYKNFKLKYNIYFNEKFVNGDYKICNIENTKLVNILNDNWSNIKFNNLIEFCQTLNKMKFYQQDVSEFQKIIDKRFDDDNNIKKLIDYITNNFIDINEDDDENIRENKKFNFKFIIDNLKSNGYLLFEQYNKILQNRYKQSINYEILLKDKKLIKFFLFIVAEKESNTVNSMVNEILIKMRNYIYDLEDNYNNNIGYKNITIVQNSEKYRNIDLSKYNRNKTNFNIFKYSKSIISDIDEYKLNDEISPYFDIYKSFYRSRYPDRNLEFNIKKSTTIVKSVFKEKEYFIHMSLLQYLILDLLYKNIDGESINNISKKLNIEIKNLEKGINSLLKIKLIKKIEYSEIKNIENLVLTINYDFENENKKISISNMVEENESEESYKKEFIHDRDTIILANLYDYIKKNKFGTTDVFLTELQYKIPFKINIDQINNAIKIALEKEHIKKIDVPNNNNTSNQIMYSYIN
jgi:hypothetical protein